MIIFDKIRMKLKLVHALVHKNAKIRASLLSSLYSEVDQWSEIVKIDTIHTRNLILICFPGRKSTISSKMPANGRRKDILI